jgi:hypothetical protein
MKSFFKKYFWRLGFILLGIGLTISNYLTFIENQKLDKTEKPILVKIVAKGKLRAKWIDVEYKNKIYNRIEIPNSNYWANLVDSIPLIYNKNKDDFYVPHSSNMNKRFLYGSIFVLILSFLPWNKIDRLVNNNKK